MTVCVLLLHWPGSKSSLCLLCWFFVQLVWQRLREAAVMLGDLDLQSSGSLGFRYESSRPPLACSASGGAGRGRAEGSSHPFLHNSRDLKPAPATRPENQRGELLCMSCASSLIPNLKTSFLLLKLSSSLIFSFSTTQKYLIICKCPSVLQKHHQRKNHINKYLHPTQL